MTAILNHSFVTVQIFEQGILTTTFNFPNNCQRAINLFNKIKNDCLLNSDLTFIKCGEFSVDGLNQKSFSRIKFFAI